MIKSYKDDGISEKVWFSKITFPLQLSSQPWKFEKNYVEIGEHRTVWMYPNEIPPSGNWCFK